ncbi:hypothetical protein GA0111570_105300 [Raineyella antarctica]|uniref:Uncharacterized protein n=1 Tax=Raineyella antarctica TaxID=1577474 RepID=A0A1G6GYP8_9ACTN|nr:hypothetical protein [Raineyella antarctica]SDB87152.1 hypothetical protein GA0111570_105300 [Raineyella antarctica]
MTSENTDTSLAASAPGSPWHAVGDYSFDWPEVTLPFQREWAAAIDSDFPADGDITCDPRTFMPLENAIVARLAVSAADPEAARLALDAAASRFYLVDVEGREYTSDELDEAAAEDEVYTVSYVSDAEIIDGTAVITNIDTDGEHHPWMFRTFLRIVAEELRRAGAVPARISPPRTPELQEWLASRGTAFPTDAELAR